MFTKIPRKNFVKSPLKFCLISQILVYSLWRVGVGNNKNTVTVCVYMMLDYGGYLVTLLIYITANIQ